MSLDYLFTPKQFGALHLKNSFVVPPLTRQRADPSDGIPNDLIVEHYSMRTSFGMIITECSPVSKKSACFAGAPGIYSQEQVAGWKRVVDSVHAKGGLFLMQIWHSGRGTVVPQTQEEKEQNLPPKFFGDETATPDVLTKEGIKQVIEEFRQGAINAKNAGFDGLELHAANGYLVDTFLRDSSNHRTDEYGGSIENRSRFCLEVMDALISVFGADRVGLRLSPTGRINAMKDSDPIKLLEYLLPELEKRNVAFVEIKRHGKTPWDAPSEGASQIPTETYFQTMRSLFKGNLIANDGISLDEMKSLLSSNTVDAVALGYLSMTNPDLPERIKNGWEIEHKVVEKDLWYSQGPKGYNDYLPYQQKQQS